MKIKEGDIIRLKDGREAVVIDLTRPGVVYIAEMPTPCGESPYEDFFVEHAEIVEVLPANHPLPNPYATRDWWVELMMEKYEEIFDEQFPLMLVEGMENAEIVSIIESCLDAGKPHETDLRNGVKY